MKRKYLLPLFIFFSILTTTGALYWKGVIPLESFQRKDPMIQGRRLLYAGRYAEAEREFKKALSEDPANARALSALGTIYYRQGDMKLAYQYWTEALKIIPGDPTLTGLVKALEQDKFKPGALYHMEVQTVDHAPPWERHFTKGQNLYLKGEYPQAVEELKKASDLKPDDSKIHFVLGAAYLKLNTRDLAVRAWEKALELDPEDRMIRELLDKIKKQG